MDPLRNPFSPGAGAPPPELAGRENILSKADLLIARVRSGKPGKSFIMVGLRGVGKTVLLNQIQNRAQAAGNRTVLAEAHEKKKLPELLAPALRKLIFSLDRMEGVSAKAKRALAVLKSFLSGLKVKVAEIELSIDPIPGLADSGDLESDLPDLFEAVAEAAAERKTSVVILIDELQYLSQDELSALIMAMHRIAQKNLPLSFIGAGLPIIPALAGESKSYAERLFEFPEIGPLADQDARMALNDPAEKEGSGFTQAALDEIIRVTKGYPYFIQEWGFQSWNLATTSPIDIEVIKQATAESISALDESFFRVRFDRLTPRERTYLRALAELGPGQHRSGDVAALMKITVSQAAPIRNTLIQKGMIYSPSHGDIAFSVPLFDEFMRRTIADCR
jgi:AAA ATPase domain